MTCRFAVRVRPAARRAGLGGFAADGTLRLAVAAPPEGGRANREVEAVIADALGLPKRAVRVARGAASRSKWVEVDGMDETEARRRIARALAGGRNGTGD